MGISVVARADILPADDMITKLREVAGEEAAARIEAIDLDSFAARGRGISRRVGKQTEVFGQAYADFAKFVAEEESNIVVTIRDIDAGCASVSGKNAGGGSTASAAPVSTIASAPSGNTAGGATTASAAPVSTVAPAPGERSFEGDMVLESRQRGTNPPEWDWVRLVNLEKWKNFEPPLVPTVVKPWHGYHRER